MRPFVLREFWLAPLGLGLVKTGGEMLPERRSRALSFALQNGFELRTEQINGLEFQEIARALKVLAAEQGFSEDTAIDNLVRLGPAAAVAAMTPVSSTKLVSATK
jgi:hypothetical protein